MPERFSFEEPPKGEPVETEDTSKVGEVLDKEKTTEGKETEKGKGLSKLDKILDKIREKDIEIPIPEWLKKTGEYVKEGTKKTTWGFLKIAGWALVIGLWLSLKTVEKTLKLTAAGIEKGPKGITEEVGKGFQKITEKIAGKKADKK